MMDDRRHEGHEDHVHGPSCGHTSERHGDHVHYMHDGHAHRQHESHWDECSIEERMQPMAGSDPVAISDEQDRPRSRAEMAEEMRNSTGP
jgi:hypothetical protein